LNRCNCGVFLDSLRHLSSTSTASLSTSTILVVPTNCSQRSS
jgi:hypothetical protein